MIRDSWRACGWQPPCSGQWAIAVLFTPVNVAFCTKFLHEQRYYSLKLSSTTGEGCPFSHLRKLDLQDDAPVFVANSGTSGRDIVPVQMLQSIIQPEPLNPEVVNERIRDATRGVTGIHPVSGIAKNAAAVTGNVQTVSNEIDMWSSILGPLKAFNSVARGIGEGAMTILIGASQVMTNVLVADHCRSGRP
ncbi:hypothetical protein BDR06DRAFT_975868 [Suillus hirtellus]|nr:hypothetical protein BDR06DRAFT_975868 [Suillus hirtellus]